MESRFFLWGIALDQEDAGRFRVGCLDGDCEKVVLRWPEMPLSATICHELASRGSD